MPTFHYKAKKGATETISGLIEARSQDQAVELINQLGLLPVLVEEEDSLIRSRGKPRAQKIPLRELSVFTRQLANLIKVGIPILQVLTIIGKQTRNHYFKEVIQTVQQGIEQGATLSNCLNNFPQIFSPLYIALVRAGEESGNLREMLARVSEHQRSQEAILSKVKAALAYPILMALLGTATVIFILTYVMPRITTLFSYGAEQLPLPTKILLAVSTILIKGWLWIILAAALIVFFVRQWSRSDQGRFALSTLKLKIPFYGGFIQKVELARLCRTLGLLLKSGSALIRGFQIAVSTLTNERIKQELDSCQKELEFGTSMGGSLQRSNLIPSMVVNLIAVGEESGMLEETLRDISESYEQDIEETIKTMTSLLEPLMILLVGSVVGFIVVAMLLPIFQIDMLAR